VFPAADPVPLVPADGLQILELFHGPTGAGLDEIRIIARDPLRADLIPRTVPLAKLGIGVGRPQNVAAGGLVDQQPIQQAHGVEPENIVLDVDDQRAAPFRALCVDQDCP